MGAVEKSEFEPNEKRMTNDHTRTGLNDATTLDSTLSFSLDAYDEIAHFFQTGKFMRVSDVEAAFLLIPLHPDLWPFFMHKFKASAGDAVERLCMNVFGDFGARGMPGTFHLLFTGRGYYAYNNFPVAPGVRSDASRTASADTFQSRFSGS